MNLTLKFLIIAVLCVHFGSLEKSSKNIFPLCSRRVADVGKCLKDALYKLRPQLASGKIGPGFTTPPLDPYVLRDFEVGGLPFLKLTLPEVTISGTTKFNIIDIRAYFEGDYLKFMPYVAFDRLDVKGKYSLNGIIPLPLSGEVSFSLNDIKIRGNGSVHLYDRNGEKYFNIERATLKFEHIRPGNIRYSLPVGPTIPSIIGNVVFRLLGDPITKAVYRALEKRIDKVHVDVANSFIKNVPVSYFFSE